MQLIDGLLQTLDGLLILLVNAAFALNLVLQLVDSLLQQDFIVQQLLYFPHTIANHYLQLLLLQVHRLQLLRAQLGRSKLSLAGLNLRAFFRMEGTGYRGGLRYPRTILEFVFFNVNIEVVVDG